MAGGDAETTPPNAGHGDVGEDKVRDRGVARDREGGGEGGST